jgi:hypothetical protein|tara:strand:- start:925 stop:1509 length:585 start_codon:yes stop_codon:yes gene_type:complete
MASLFDKLESEAFRKGLAARSKEANQWFAKNVTKLGKIGSSKLLGDDRLTKQGGASPGDMVVYTYDPKLKATLPYYDTFPLTIVVGPAKDGFYGINLHYLPPKVRAIFLDKLNDITNNQKFDKTTRFKVTYKLLQSTANYKYFKPCFKHYLTKNVTSNIMKVNAAEWNIAIFLQTAKFKKASIGTVWSDSRRSY